MALMNSVTFLVLKILRNLVSMRNSLNAKTAEVSKISKTIQRDLTLTFNVLLEYVIHFVSNAVS